MYHTACPLLPLSQSHMQNLKLSCLQICNFDSRFPTAPAETAHFPTLPDPPLSHATASPSHHYFLSSSASPPIPFSNPWPSLIPSFAVHFEAPFISNTAKGMAIPIMQISQSNQYVSDGSHSRASDTPMADSERRRQRDIAPSLGRNSFNAV